MKAGLPESILKPILFSIFINGLDDKVKYPSSSFEQAKGKGTVHKKYKSRAAHVGGVDWLSHEMKNVEYCITVRQ